MALNASMERRLNMRKATDQLFGKAFQDWLKEARMEEKFRSVSLLEAWPKLMGPMIAKHTTRLQIIEGVLYLSVDSAPLRQELIQGRDKIRQLLNQEAGADMIKEVVVR